MMKRMGPWLIAMGLLVGIGFNVGALGFFLFTWGEEIYDVGPLTGSLATEYPGMRAAYKCMVFGVFWANFHVWNCEPVVSDGESYYDDPSLGQAVSEAYSMSDAERGVWNKHGRWVFLAIILIWILSMFGSKSEDT